MRSRDEMGDLFRDFGSMAKSHVTTATSENRIRIRRVPTMLRAPGNGIKGNLDMASEGITQPKDALSQSPRPTTTSNSSSTTWLEIARADSGNLQIELSAVDLVGSYHKAAASFEPVAKKAGMELITELPRIPVAVMADAGKLNEVMSNLLSNAIKYGRVGGHVTVKLVEQESKAIITVEDNGLGISEEAQQHLFQKFYRSPEANASGVTGTGLGLYITRELVQRMKGAVTFKSTLGSGTAFAIAFRLSGKS